MMKSKQIEVIEQTELLPDFLSGLLETEDWNIVKDQGMQVASNAAMLVAVLDDIPEAVVQKRNAIRTKINTGEITKHQRALYVKVGDVFIFFRTGLDGRVQAVITKKDLNL